MVTIGYPHTETLSKSRRSLKTSLSHGSLSHAVVIDALGNAEAEVSVPALAVGARGDFAVSVQHASVRVLGKLDSEEVHTCTAWFNHENFVFINFLPVWCFVFS